MGKRREVHRDLVGKPEGKRSLGRPRSRWEDDIKMDLQEVGSGVIDWIELAQDYHKLFVPKTNARDNHYCSINQIIMF